MDVLPAFTCARAIGHLWSICLGAKNLSQLAKSKECEANICSLSFPCAAFIGNIPLLKELTVTFWPSWRAFTLSKVFLFLFLPSRFLYSCHD